MTRLLPVLATAALLAACSQTPRLPAPGPAGYPAPEPVEDWEDWGDQRSDVPPGGRIDEGAVIGTLLSGEEIRSAVRGETLDGCFPNESTFTEYLAPNGNFYVADAGDEPAGRWGVKDEALCFDYPNDAADSCFRVSRSAGGLHFYNAELTAYLASTRCPMRFGAD